MSFIFDSRRHVKIVLGRDTWHVLDKRGDDVAFGYLNRNATALAALAGFRELTTAKASWRDFPIVAALVVVTDYLKIGLGRDPNSTEAVSLLAASIECAPMSECPVWVDTQWLRRRLDAGPA